MNGYLQTKNKNKKKREWLLSMTGKEEVVYQKKKNRRRGS